MGGVTELGVYCAVTCAGAFVRVRATGELKFPTDWTVTVVFPHWPWLTTSRDGFALILKSELTGVTVSFTTTLCVMRGRLELPVIVTLYVPTGVLVEVGMVNVDDTDCPELGVTEEGTMLAWVPCGSPPVTWRFTFELKLPMDVTVRE